MLDVASVIDSVVEIDEGAVANPDIAVVTLTVTEAGYLPDARPPRLLVDGLRKRRDMGASPIAVVPCDNVASNAVVLRDAILALAEPELVAWVTDNVSFVSTMVDRITPATTDADRAIARELLGWDDRVPVVTEPFTEWVLQGDFPAGRPEWELAGRAVRRRRDAVREPQALAAQTARTRCWPTGDSRPGTRPCSTPGATRARRRGRTAVDRGARGARPAARRGGCLARDPAHPVAEPPHRAPPGADRAGAASRRSRRASSRWRRSARRRACPPASPRPRPSPPT
ncbi:MAG: hypothetical protein WDM88_05885 [Galbitalea sp.]